MNPKANNCEDSLTVFRQRVEHISVPDIAVPWSLGCRLKPSRHHTDLVRRSPSLAISRIEFSYLNTFLNSTSPHSSLRRSRTNSISAGVTSLSVLNV